MTTSYSYQLSGRKGLPYAAELRREDPGKPHAGDLLAPGSIVRTSYGTGPYLVDRITPTMVYDDYRVWNLTGFSSQDDGSFLRDEHRRIWINELVADWSDGEAIIRKLFVANSDVVLVEQAIGFLSDRRGQGLLL
ncbi:hypothetical protein [Novosphingobium clariflavum]|uniref:Uncharacterized protein n=1 Tax=Novosphingobium clariflavum TaxID=2029884 RepID=A0ABV6S1V7_9SPHN|nr:hypothetical protein [Novosphingobium clariflavum]